MERFSQNTTRLTSPTLQPILSPLTRVAYSFVPERHHLAVLVSGRAEIKSQSATALQIHAPAFVWREGGKGEELVVEGGARGLHVLLPQLAFMRALPASAMGDQMRQTLSQNLYQQMDVGSALAKQIEGLTGEIDRREPGHDVAVSHQLSLILIHVWRLARVNPAMHGHVPQSLVERFVTMARQYRHEHRRVSDYAQVLGVSRDRLGSAVLRATGLSPQQFLHREILREAHELLRNTALPIAQVAFRLGYTDSAYFSRFFTKQTGETPNAFRRRAKLRNNLGTESFAAWP